MIQQIEAWSYHKLTEEISNYAKTFINTNTKKTIIFPSTPY